MIFLKDLIFYPFTSDPKYFADRCSFYRPTKEFVESLGGHWHFISCEYDPEYPAYRVEYSSLDGRRMHLTVLAVGGKYPPDITFSISG